MITPIEIAKVTMTEEKKASAKNDWFAYYIGRPASYVLTIPFLYMKVKPNTISFLSFFPSVLGFIFLSFGKSKEIQVVGALLFIIWNLMDGVDGNVARYTKQTSTLGTLWDAASGYFDMMLMYFAAGISIMNNLQGFLYGYCPDYFYVVFAGLTSMLSLFSRLVMHKKMVLFGNETGSRLSDKENYSKVKILALNITSPSGFIQVFLLFSVLFNCIRIFVIVYFGIQIMATLYSLWVLLKK